MKGQIKQRILTILDQIIGEITTRDSFQIKKLSNYCIHNASVFQDENSISIAVIVYSIGKLVDRYKEDKDSNYREVFKKLVFHIKKAKTSLRKNNPQEYEKQIKICVSLINKLDDKFTRYIEEVIESAKIKKGSSLYEHGVSVARASHLLGVSQWDLLNYIGKTNIPDQFKDRTYAKNRLDFARQLFN